MMEHTEYDKGFYQENIYVHYESLLRRLYFMTQDPDTAGELAEETMRLAWTGLDQLREPQEAKAWLFELGDQTAGRYFKAHFPKDAARLEDAALYETQDESADVLEDLLKRETIQTVWTAIEKLDAGYRSILQLRHYEGMSLQEIATALNRDYTTIKAKHHRALLELKELIDGSR